MKQTVILTMFLISSFSVLAQADISFGAGIATKGNELQSAPLATFLFCGKYKTGLAIFSAGAAGRASATDGKKFGFATAGIENPYGFSISLGVAVGGNAQKRDVHILPSGEEKVITEGEKSANWTSLLASIKYEMPRDRSHYRPFTSLSYVNKDLWFNFGVTYAFNF